MTLLEWVAQVREKFGIVGLPTDDYWRGYVSCLEDVERFGQKAEREGGPSNR